MLNNSLLYIVYLVYIGYIYPMRKNIDIPIEIVKDLKKMAVDADKDLKNYIQDLLIEHAKKHKKK
jgi:hypothetical protein